MNYIIYLWVAAIAVFVIVELMTTALTTIWFAGGALVALFVAMAGFPVWVQAVVFLLVSIALLALTRPLANKYFNRKTVKTNAESLIGREAIVSEEINNLKDAGVVKVNGQEWTARTDENSVTIPAGTVVEIERIEGVKLIVKQAAQ